MPIVYSEDGLAVESHDRLRVRTECSEVHGDTSEFERYRYEITAQLAWRSVTWPS